MGKNARMAVVGFAVTLIWMTLSAVTAFSHCEIPCGIYGDEMRFAMMKEDIATIEKSMKQIVELSKQASPNHNQIVRWVQNKETPRRQDPRCRDAILHGPAGKA